MFSHSIREWNALPTRVTDVDNLKSFKGALNDTTAAPSPHPALFKL